LASLPVSLYDARESREMAGGDAALAARGILALFFPLIAANAAGTGRNRCPTQPPLRMTL